MKKVVDVPDLNVTRGHKRWQDVTWVRGSGNAKSMQHPNWPCWEHRIMLICARCSSVAACHQTSRRQQNGKNEKKEIANKTTRVKTNEDKPHAFSWSSWDQDAIVRTASFILRVFACNCGNWTLPWEARQLDSEWQWQDVTSKSFKNADLAISIQELPSCSAYLKL